MIKVGSLIILMCFCFSGILYAQTRESERAFLSNPAVKSDARPSAIPIPVAMDSADKREQEYQDEASEKKDKKEAPWRPSIKPESKETTDAS